MTVWARRCAYVGFSRMPIRSATACYVCRAHAQHMVGFDTQLRIKCNEDDTIGDLKKLVAAQTGTRAEKIRM